MRSMNDKGLIKRIQNRDVVCQNVGLKLRGYEVKVQNKFSRASILRRVEGELGIRVSGNRLNMRRGEVR